MQLRALLFDVDGTLVDTEELHRQAFNQVFLTFGLSWNWDRDCYATLLGVSGGVERISSFIDGLDAPAAEKTRIRRLVPGIHREKTKLYGELRGSNAVRLRPGIGRLVDEALSLGVRIGLASTSALANVLPLLQAAFGSATAARIDAVIGADLVQRKKPAPDLYELLLTTLGLPARACVAFEDSANGLSSAKAAGLFTVVTPTQWTREQVFERADLLLPSLGDPDMPLEPDATLLLGGNSYLSLDHLQRLHAIARTGVSSP
jgi:beta-phosphoglucomutase-like phosphatase (HAD superfamily)